MRIYLAECTLHADVLGEGLERKTSNVTNTDNIMNDTFWIGIYPGLSEEMLDLMVEKLEAFFGVNC